jgi:hypothetical protein
MAASGMTGSLSIVAPALQPAFANRKCRRRHVEQPSEQHPGYPKPAACVCGALTVSVSAPPLHIHACACLDCQRRSGSAFTCTAFFPEAAVEICGEFHSFRRIADSGRINEASFCPMCGSSVLSRLEGLPGVVGVAVGCFGDPAFEKPGTLYWTIRRHGWLATPLGAAVVERQ